MKIFSCPFTLDTHSMGNRMSIRSPSFCSVCRRAKFSWKSRESESLLDCKQSIFRTFRVNSSINPPAFFENPMVFSIKKEYKPISSEIYDCACGDCNLKQNFGNILNQLDTFEVHFRHDNNFISRIYPDTAIAPMCFFQVYY